MRVGISSTGNKEGTKKSLILATYNVRGMPPLFDVYRYACYPFVTIISPSTPKKSPL